MTASKTLAGCGVLVTRPAGQAEPLCRLIEAAGGRPIRFPTIAIEPTRDAQAAVRLAEPWDLMYFVSPNAVDQAIALVGEGTWPRVKWIAAVGRGTARMLETAGRAPDLVPNERYDSESLLAMPELADMRGRRVLIVRGEGGRELFAQAMRERGAEVFFAEVYRRVRPAVDSAPLIARWQDEVQLAIATSDEVLINLVELIGQKGRAQLLATSLVVIAERTAQTAHGLGFATVRVAARADDTAILESLIDLAGGGRR
ncbi:uroporphyrinogen-III synthase [Caldichromatium japonicum]|uniref:Uroporphyrinogen-III synthase n=1 Tax=Caldichromatium japonicum TaxID=2699430 RepID=A0A6G7VAF1_9GAMM|nr:uroporphyrinogen-III synthase [Caldichromatium japonicum]QIK36991.1 uroporphyrinogen-III synthase [Caldichromatium japonicum]